MTPEDPQEKPRLPSRQRKVLENLEKSHENDLWDLEGKASAKPKPAAEETSEEPAPLPKPAPPSASASGSIQRDILSSVKKTSARKSGPAKQAPIRLDASSGNRNTRQRSKKEHTISKRNLTGQSNLREDLDLWDDALPDLPEHSEAKPEPVDASPTPEETQPPEATAAPEPATEASPEEPTNLDTEQIANEEPAPVEQPVEPLAEDTNELEPAPSPAPAQRVSFSLPQLSLLEKISISALIVILLGAGIYIASNSINKIPGTKAADELALPIKGKNMTIENVKTYWVEKTSADGTVLRDDEETNIVPVIQLHSSGKPATVRVFFRNEENDAVGDTITTTLTPGKAVDIAGSEGFHEFGKFAAYRAGTTEPWSVEVYEGPNERANLEEFKKILETTISITRH